MGQSQNRGAALYGVPIAGKRNVTLECLQCGGSYLGERRRLGYCSSTCRQRAYRQHQAKERNDELYDQLTITRGHMDCLWLERRCENCDCPCHSFPTCRRCWRQTILISGLCELHDPHERKRGTK